MTARSKAPPRSALFPALLLALAALAGLSCASVAPAPPAAAPAPHYAAVIDAGSSGSRIYLYEWRPGGAVPWVVAAPFPPGEERAWEMKVEPGLSEFAGDPDGVARSLAPLVSFALDKLDIAPDRPSPHSIYLLATGGVRQLDEPERQAVLAAARAYLESTPFRVGGVRAISGREEGVFGWVGVNYALGYLARGGPFPTVGVLDLGGVSTQITFVPLDFPRAEEAALELGGTTYRLYTHSYSGYGQDLAREAVADPACYPAGFDFPEGELGAGDFDGCVAAIRRVLERSCEGTAPCTWMGSYQPPLYGDFFALAAFEYAARFFGLEPDLRIDELERRGRDYCASDWQTIRVEYADQLGNPYLPRHCFTAAFLVSLLRDGYGFEPGGSRIVVPGNVQGVEANWALGALVYELAGGRID